MSPLFLSLLVVLVYCCYPVFCQADLAEKFEFSLSLPQFGTSQHRYIGCYEDRLDVRERALPYSQWLEPEMRVEKCLQHCTERGFPYAGLEFERECYCSKNQPKYPTVGAERCRTRCKGARTSGEEASDAFPCGGGLALAVYEQTSPSPAVQPNSSRPLLCLSMIVKNEAHTILNTIDSIKDIIGCYLVLDTGSTDGTQDKIREALKHIPQDMGKILEEPFIDYGASRNRALKLGRTLFNPHFSLVLSADEKVNNPDELYRQLKDLQFAYGRQHGAYPIILNAGHDFDSVRVSRTEGEWEYVGRVHEYLTSPEHAWVDLYRFSPEVRVQFQATDHERRFNSQYFIIKILLEDLIENPKDTRALSYLGSTFEIVGNFTESLHYWTLLGEYTGSRDEKFRAFVEAGQVANRIFGQENTKKTDSPAGENSEASSGSENERIRTFLHSWRRVESYWLAAHSAQPTYMNGLHHIGQFYYNANYFALGFFFSRRAAAIPRPAILDHNDPNYKTRDIFIRNSEYLYEYEGNRLLGFSAEAVGEYSVCAGAFKKVLDVHPQDNIAKDRMAACEKRVTGGSAVDRTKYHPSDAELEELSYQLQLLQELEDFNRQGKDFDLRGALEKIDREQRRMKIQFFSEIFDGAFALWALLVFAVIGATAALLFATRRRKKLKI